LGPGKLQIHAVAALGSRRVFDSAALKTAAGPSIPLRYAQGDSVFRVALEGKIWKPFLRLKPGSRLIWKPFKESLQ
jgi:hypothetical protein